MLKKRIITASILAGLVITIILYSPTNVVSLMAAMVFIVAGWEWTKLIGIAHNWQRISAIGIVVAGCYLYKIFNLPILIPCIIAGLWWLIGLAAIIVYPRGAILWRNSFLGFLIGGILFIPAWLALDTLHASPNFGPVWVIFLCFLVWATDIGGYVIGSLWGKKQLLPKVSSGKTWCGVIGAFLFAAMVIKLFATYGLQQQKIMILVGLGLLVVVFTIIGDLVESLFKRVRGVKDSGNILPGHGGILDRIDGFLAAVPIFMLGVKIFYA